MSWGLPSKGWTAVDAGGGTALSAVSLGTSVRPGNKPQVLAAATVHAETGTADITALRELLAKAPRGLPQLVTLPRSGYALRVMPEPAVPPREMANSLRWAVSVDSERPEEELNMAWMSIPTEAELPTRQRQVYAISSPTASLQAQVEAWKAAGLRPKVVDIRETALRNIAARLEQPGEGLALVAADAEGVCIVFTHRGALYLDRFIPQTVAEVTQVEAADRLKLYERIALQLERSVDVINRSYPFMPVKRVVLAPMPDRPGCAKWLQGRLSLKVERLDLNAVVDLSAVPELAESATMQARCLVPLGAALRGVRSGA